MADRPGKLKGAHVTDESKTNQEPTTKDDGPRTPPPPPKARLSYVKPEKYKVGKPPEEEEEAGKPSADKQQP
jgi:hypothetical protein